MLFCRLLIFFLINFLKKFFKKYHRNVKKFRFVRPDLSPNCLPRLSADDTGRQRVKKCMYVKQNENSFSLLAIYLEMKHWI